MACPWSAIVVTECLFIHIAEQMEWFDRNIGSTQSALQAVPEVFNSVSVNVAIYVFFQMIDYLVIVFLLSEVVSGNSSV